ncbi:MAG: PIN/TRAM domain-containing protein [Actinomycetota bacterium]|nr:TRAM domain-containing protein [Actinomycetota bacterium]
MNRERQGTGPTPRGALVEFVRLIIVVIVATAGYAVAKQITSGSRVVLGIILGSAVGYVAGGVLGRGTATAMHTVEREFRRTPAAEIVAGALGLLLGLIMALLVTFPLFKLPDQAVWPAVAFIYLTLPYLGYRVARTKHGDIFSMLGLKPRAAGVGRSEVNVIDTSALLDGRMHQLVQTGFLGGVLLIPRGVLGELQRISDSSDPRRRALGRRGMDLLATLQRDPTVEVILVEDEAMGDVDAGLVRMARDRGGAVVTADANLAKVAEVLNVPVRSINALAAAMRTPFTPGEQVGLRLTREGREHGQAIGYLDDGTMVVVEEGRELIGTEVEVRVTNVLQTATGRMLFATLSEAVSP